MANISNFKRVRTLIKERTSNKKLFTIITFTFVLLIIFSSLTNFHFTNSVKLKFLDFSSYVLKSFYMPLNTFRNSGDNINNIFNAYRINEQLLSENELLKSQLIENKNLKAENLELRSLLHLKTNTNYSYVTAEIISQNNFSFFHSMILEVGSIDKIDLKSPVIYNNHLVGFISDLGVKSSRVTLITDINTKVPAYILNKDLKFIITGNNSNFLEILSFGNVDLLREGDEVYTSGDGNRYPKGLLLGKVVKDLDGKFLIQTSLSISKLNYVQVIEWTPLSRGIDIKIDNSIVE